MNFSRADLPHLKLSLLAFMFSVLIGGGILWLSTMFLDHAHQARQAAQRQLIDARKKLGDAQSDFANISIYAREYASLVEHKIIGSEQRLDWMEELAALHQHHYVGDFKYTIAPQQPYLPNPALDTGNFELKLSGLNLQLDLLHEMQLMRFLDALRSNSKGWFIIDHCTLERSNATSNLTAPLKAECAGGWVTMHKKGAP
jgi:hypothetical protein